MNDEHTSGRVYSDDEVALILRRATEIRPADGSPSAGGLTLPELETVGREAGIDVEAIRRAAREVDVGSYRPGAGERLLGGPNRVVEEETVPGVLSEEGFERVVAAIQTAAVEQGQATRTGRSLTWRNTFREGYPQTQLSVTSHDDATRVIVHDDLSPTTSVMRVIGFAASAVGSILSFVAAERLFVSPWGLLAIPLVVGAVWTGVRGWYRKVLRERRGIVARLLDGVVREAADAVADPPPPSSEALGPRESSARDLP